jgi:hypothetical protein
MKRVALGEPNLQILSRPGIFLLFSLTFLVRVPQDCEGFEQSRPQLPVLPSGFFDDYQEQSALLRGGLLGE